MVRSFMPTPQTELAGRSGPVVVESELTSPRVLTPYASTINALGSERVSGSTTDPSGPAIPLTGVSGVGSGLAGPGPDVPPPAAESSNAGPEASMVYPQTLPDPRTTLAEVVRG